MTRIVTTTYRYRPPPKRKGRKLAEITGPAVVTAKKSRRPGPLRGGAQAAADGSNHQAVAARQSIRLERADRAQSTTARASDGTHILANDDRKSVIVTVRGRKTVRRQREQQQMAKFMAAEVSPETKDLVDRMMFGRWPGRR